MNYSTLDNSACILFTWTLSLIFSFFPPRWNCFLKLFSKLTGFNSLTTRQLSPSLGQDVSCLETLLKLLLPKSCGRIIKGRTWHWTELKLLLLLEHSQHQISPVHWRQAGTQRVTPKQPTHCTHESLWNKEPAVAFFSFLFFSLNKWNNSGKLWAPSSWHRLKKNTVTRFCNSNQSHFALYLFGHYLKYNIEGT